MPTFDIAATDTIAVLRYYNVAANNILRGTGTEAIYPIGSCVSGR